MKKEKSWKDRIAERLDSWKGELEDLKVQLALGRMEAEEKFHEQKSRIGNWIDHNKENLDDLEDEFGDEVKELRHKMESFRHKVREAEFKGKREFDEQKAHLNQHMEEMVSKLRNISNSGSEKAKHLLEDWEDDMHKFRTRLDMMALHAHLAKRDVEDEAEELKDEAKEKLDEIKGRIADLSEDAEDKWHVIRSEIGEAFTNIRKAWQEKS